MNASLDNIWEIETMLGKLRGLEGLDEDRNDLKALYFEVQCGFDKLKKDISENVFEPEALSESSQKGGILPYSV